MRARTATAGTVGPKSAGRPPWTLPGLVAAGALVVIVALVVAFFTSRSGQRGDSSSPAAAGEQTQEGSAAGKPQAGAPPTAVPTGPPTDVTWQLIGQAAVPSSASAGPRRISGGTASGYAHTPIGALVATTQLEARAGLDAGRSVWEPTITRQFVPSADRDKLLAALRAQPPERAGPGELAQLTGFRYISYTPDTAVIGLVIKSPRGAQYAITTLTVLWRDGDWRMVAPPGAAWSALTQRLTDMSNVVVWGPR